MTPEHPAGRPRIAYLINQYPKISHTFIRTEILELEKLGFDILRIAIRGWDAEIVESIDIEEKQKTNYLLHKGTRLPLMALGMALVTQPVRTLRAAIAAVRMGYRGERSLPYHLMYLAEACRAKVLTDQYKIGHVHAHFGSNAAEVAQLLHALGGPTFSFTVHGPEEFDKAHQIKLKEKVKSASFVVCVSSFGRGQLFRFADVNDWYKIKVVHCGVSKDYLDAEVNRMGKSPRLVCIGRFCEQKGQLILVRSCKILADRGIQFELVLIGDGEARADIEREIAVNALGEYVHLAGWCDAAAIRQHLAVSKALVMPSLAEGLPLVIMEAMAVSRPIISTYIAGIPELVRDEVDGLLVFSGSELHLADAIGRLLSLNEEKLEEMGKCARERVIERHCAAKEAAKLGGLFRTASRIGWGPPTV